MKKGDQRHLTLSDRITIEKGLNNRCSFAEIARQITARSYMRGYRDIYGKVGPFHKLMIRFCDSLVKMKIVRIVFGG